MLKKVPIHNPSDLSCVQKKTNCCSMCKSRRHVICNNCQYNASNLKSINDDDDYVPEKECAPNSKKEILYSQSGVSRRDMSSGDHSRSVEPYKSIAISNNRLIKTEPASMTKGCSKCEPETTVIYKNEKFHADRSNITSDYVSPIYEFTKEPNYESIARPVVCPITSCGKMVTIDSFSQHFNFDHSKVPKLILNKSATQEVLINYSALSEETKCVATFVTSRDKRSSHTALRRITSHTNIHNFNKDCDLLLLMVVKMETTPTKFCIRKCNSRNSVDRSYALINDIPKRNMQDQSSVSKSQSENKIRVNKGINKDEDEVILLWLCRLKDKTTVYTINVSREDNQQGYSYIGDAVHIRNEQDPISIYNSTECLSLRGTAIKKLVTAERELKVKVSTVQ
ncbi:unnamed protein product [Arctia plantaginis]|uniref:DUF4729 domain-containing protein n=1 Tax=Arctia plantaginis TaxID=874455 RepID=A0A8S1AC80_ARCPL|nr:unnamed protein product [Arctia plantaginis]